MPKKHTLFWLASVVLIAGVLRFYGLWQQGMVFWDEGYIAQRAQAISSGLSSSAPSFPILTYDIKLLWLLLIALVHSWSQDAFLGAKILSALLGTGTVALTFLLALKVYHCRRLGLISAGFLAVSWFHIFYCRLALPDAAATFLVALSLICYLSVPQRPWLGGVFAGWALGSSLLIHYRCIFFVFFILIWESRSLLSSRPDAKQSLLRFSVFLASTIVLLSAFEFFCLQMTSSSYFSLWRLYGQNYSIWHFEPLSFYSFFYLFAVLNGIPALGLLLVSLIFGRGRYPTHWLWSFVILQLIFYSITVHPYPRLFATSLPLLALLSAAAFENLLALMQSERHQKLAVIGLGLVLAIGAIQTWGIVSNWRTGVDPAAEWLQKNLHRDEGILATNSLLLNHELPGRPAQLLYDQEAGQLEGILRQGVRFAVIDNHRFIFGIEQIMRSRRSTSLVSRIEDSCEPAASFRAFSAGILERFLQENIYPDLRGSLNAGTADGRLNEIKIYDLEACFGKNP